MDHPFFIFLFFTWFESSLVTQTTFERLKEKEEKKSEGIWKKQKTTTLPFI